MYHIEREIAQQPDIIQQLLTHEANNIATIAQAIRDFDPAYVLIAARGTSDNAARYGQYLMGIHNGLVVSLATPSVHTLYQSPPNMSKALVIGISQSGQSADVAQVVKDARAQGALTINITNDDQSPMAKDADFHIFLRCETEISVAATKTYTAQLTVMAMLTAALSGDASLKSDIQKLPAWVAETLALSEKIPAWVERYRYTERIASIGRGYNYSTAFEVALKIKELCYIVGEEYSEADFRHGPIAIIESGFPVIVVAPKGKPLDLLKDLIDKLIDKKAECIVISNDEATLAKATKAMSLPIDIPEWLSPICAVIPGQIFAKSLALVKGHEVDKPEGLTKVTITQ